MGKRQWPLAKAILGGMLLFGALPPALYFGWGQVHAAAAGSTALRSVDEMTTKLTGAMGNRRETITFSYQGKTSKLKPLVQKAIDQAMGSDPYLYYIVDSYAFSYRGSSGFANVTVSVIYRESLQQTAYVNTQVKAALAKIVTPQMTSHQKVKVIHDWVVQRLRYDNSYTRYTAYAALKSGSAVCQGYSLLTYKLLQGAGIPVRIVEGTAKQEGGVRQSHAWNLVQLDGKWYHLDTTWDDPVGGGAQISTAYYLRTDAQMRKDHSWTKAYPSAPTPYADTLAALVAKGGPNAAAYKTLQQELDYDLYEEDQVITNSDALKTLAKQALASGEDSLLFRYRGTAAELKQDLLKLYDLGLEDLSYSSSAFENTGDLQVYVKWEL